MYIGSYSLYMIIVLLGKRWCKSLASVRIISADIIIITVVHNCVCITTLMYINYAQVCVRVHVYDNVGIQ